MNEKIFILIQSPHFLSIYKISDLSYSSVMKVQRLSRIINTTKVGAVFRRSLLPQLLSHYCAKRGQIDEKHQKAVSSLKSCLKKSDFVKKKYVKINILFKSRSINRLFTKSSLSKLRCLQRFPALRKAVLKRVK